MTGPRSDPPMPMFTTSVNALPVNPFLFPEIILSEKLRMCSRTSDTSGTTFSPSTFMVSDFRARRAVCSTALPSV